MKSDHYLPLKVVFVFFFCNKAMLIDYAPLRGK